MSLNRAMQLRRERAKLIRGDAQAIVNKAEAENRDMTAEEHQAFDRIVKSADSKLKEAEKLERLHDQQEALTESRGTVTPPETSDGGDPERDKKDYNAAFRSWLRFGKDGISAEEKAVLAARQSKDRTLVVGTPAAGGYTVPDDNRLMNTLITSQIAFGGMREVSRLIETDGGNPLPIPLGDDAMNKAVIVGEAGDHSGGDEPEFNQVVLGAFMYSSKVVTVSIELLQDNSVDIEQWLGERLGERIGRGTNEHFTVGTGTTEPFGIVTRSPLGKTGAAAQLTSIIYDDLVDLEHSVDRAYRRNARYMAHDQTIAGLKKLKDSEGRMLWVPGIASRAPDTILGYPYTVNNDMATMAASAKSLLFGDFRYYLIRQVRQYTLVRFDELYMANGQIGFLVFNRQDGNFLDMGAVAATPTYVSSPVKHFVHAAA